MNPFAGIVAFEGALDSVQFEERARTAIALPSRRRALVRRAGNAAFVQNAAANSAGRQGALSLTESGSDALFAADCRLDNRAELAAALDIDPPEFAGLSDATLVLRTVRRWGVPGVARCLGAFAFALWDANTRRLILARDCLGARALYFYRGRRHVTFATTLRTLLALPGVPREVDEITLANFMAFNFGEPHRTFYRGIERVPSRNLATIDRNSIRHRSYWSPDFDAPPPYQRDQDYVERARELFDQAVGSAIIDTPHVAIAMSGGLDLSAIAATAARLGRAADVTCYTLVPPPDMDIDVGPARYLDERNKVEALRRRYPGLELRFFTDDTAHPFERDAALFFARASVPILGPANLGAFAHIRDAVAAVDHPALLVGSAGNFGLTWGGTFSLPILLRSGHWRTFARELSVLAQHNRRGLVRTVGADVVIPIAPQFLLRLIHRLRRHDPDSVARFSPLNPAFIAEHGLTRQWRAQGFDPWELMWPSRDPARFRAYYLFDHNQFARDFVADSENVYGHETRDPHANRRLLEFLLSVPEPMYRRAGIPRSFARTVLADRLPREIVEDRRRGSQGVGWFHRLELETSGHCGGT